MAEPEYSQSLRDLIAAGPGGGAALPQRAPIGVPEGYAAQRREPMFKVGGRWAKSATSRTMPQKTVSIGPRYFDGDELLPASLSSENRARIQRDLAAAGLLTGKYRLGYWDAASQKAYAAALAYANQSGKTVKDAIAELKTHPELGTDEERAPLVVKTTSPDDLRGVFRDTSRKLLGRQLTPQELESYIAAYNQVETQRQQQAYGMEETGGAIATIPDQTAYVEERIRKEKPDEFMAHETVGRYEEFLELLGGD